MPLVYCDGCLCASRYDNSDGHGCTVCGLTETTDVYVYLVEYRSHGSDRWIYGGQAKPDSIEALLTEARLLADQGGEVRVTPMLRGVAEVHSVDVLTNNQRSGE